MAGERGDVASGLDPNATPRRLGMAAFLACLLSVSTLCACGSSTPTLNTAVVERAIAGSILAQRHLRTLVACPSSVPRKAGVHFACTAQLDVGRYPVAVTETNGQGHVVYQNPAPLVALDIEQVTHAISRSVKVQTHANATVACPGEVLQQAGLVFICSATFNGRGHTFAVTEVDGAGHVRYVQRT